MKKINIENIIGFIKENKIKTALVAGAVLIILILISIIASILGVSSNSSYSVQENLAFVDESGPATMIASKSFTGRKVYMPPSDGGGKYNPEAERKLVKNGNLSLVVKNIENSKSEIEKITKNFKGFVVSSNFSENENYKYYNGQRKLESVSKRGYFEVKVPSKDFENAFSEFKKVALKVNNESVSVRDVTEYFSDLKTQLENKKAEVQQYRNILKRAEKVEDVLKVTQYLNKAQVEAERLQGRMNLLSNQITLSSIRIEIVSESDVELFGVVWSPLNEIKEAFSNMITGLKDFANFLIAFLFKLPIYILYIGGIILAIKLVWKIILILKRKIWKKEK